MPWRNVAFEPPQKGTLACLLLAGALLVAPRVASADESSTSVNECEPSADADSATDAEPWTKDPTVEDSLARELESGRFRFCTQDGYRLWPEQKRAYCALESELAARCPELRHACQRPAWGEDEEAPSQEPSLSLFDRLPELTWLARAFFWGILAVLAFVLVRGVARHLAEEVRRRRTAHEPVRLTPEERAPEAPRETNVDRLLDRAKAEAARGDFAAALTSAHAAALHGLGERSLLKLHRSRTNGDYLRQLAEHRSEREQLRHIVRDVESVQFGHADADSSTFSRVLTAVAALTGRAAVLCLCILGSSTLLACDQELAPEPPSSPTSPDGHALLESLLTRHSKQARRRVQRIYEVPSDVARIVALGPSLRDQEWQRLLDWVASGGTLVTAGLPPQLEDPLGTGDLKSIRCTEPLTAPGLRLLQVGANTFEDAEAPSIVDCGARPFLLELEHGAGDVYAFSDDAFLRNANLAAADNAQLVVALAAAPNGNVELLGPWTGSGTHDPIETIRNAGLAPWLLQLLLLAAAYVAFRGVRFGTPREHEQESRRAFVEHAEALATQYGRAKASAYALESYGRWAALQLRKRVPVRERDLHALAHAIARRTGRDPMATLEVLVEAQAADQMAGSPEEHARTQEELSRILKEVGGPK